MLGWAEIKLFKKVWGPQWRQMAGPEWLMITQEKSNGRRSWVLHFEFKGFHNSVTVFLSSQEWRRLLNFLHQTKTGKLSKDCEGFELFSIVDNKIKYFSVKQLHAHLERQWNMKTDAVRNYRGKDAEMLSRKRAVRLVAKWARAFKRNPLIGRGIRLVKSEVEISLDGAKFLEFRAACLRKSQEKVRP